MRAYPRTAIYSLVDSVEVVEQLVRHGGSALAPGTRFQVLIELGYAGGRAGARTMEQALAVLEAVRTHRDVLELAGIEGYEGAINLESAHETIHAVYTRDGRPEIADPGGAPAMPDTRRQAAERAAR